MYLKYFCKYLYLAICFMNISYCTHTVIRYMLQNKAQYICIYVCVYVCVYIYIYIRQDTILP